MNPPIAMIRVYNGLLYSVREAVLLAGDDKWNGLSSERNGRNRFLYRTRNNHYFVVTLTNHSDEKDTLEPITPEEAINLYECNLCEHKVIYSAAFEGMEITDA
jgi:hypothetical protein